MFNNQGYKTVLNRDKINLKKLFIQKTISFEHYFLFFNFFNRGKQIIQKYI